MSKLALPFVLANLAADGKCLFLTKFDVWLLVSEQILKKDGQNLELKLKSKIRNPKSKIHNPLCQQ